MNALAINRVLRRVRRTTALVAVFCVLGGIVAVEHSGMPSMHAPATAVFCLAVLPGAALLMQRVGLARRFHWPQLVPSVRAPRSLGANTLAAPARAGPARGLVLRL